MRMFNESRTGSKPTLYMNRECHLADEELSICHKTDVFIEGQRKLQLAGFFSKELHSSRLYGMKVSLWLLCSDSHLSQHAGMANIQKFQTAMFVFLRYFINMFPCLLPKDVSGDAVTAVSSHKPSSWFPSQEG